MHKTTFFAAFIGACVAVPLTLSAVTVTHTFTDGTTADAAQVNRNFQDLAAAVTALEATAAASGAALYCGSTPATTGDIGGYAAAKALCETACGSASARMCTANDVVISSMLGTVPQFGDWYASGTLMTYSSPTRNTYDCNGWTSSSSTLWGPEVYTGGRPDSNQCSESHPVACCL